MADGNWGVIIFLVLIAAFVIYILAAAMRDRKAQLPGAEEADGAPRLSGGAVPQAQGQKFCWSCMTKLTGEETVCPACGRQTDLREKQGHLPVGLVLADRYTVGLGVAENPVGVTYLAADNYLETKHLIREYFPGEYAFRGEDGTEVSVNPGAEETFDSGKKAFVREIRQMCRLKGFSSASDVTDLFYANGTAYAVLNWAEGVSLKSFLAERGKLSPEYTLALFLPVIRQLAGEESMGLLRCNLSLDSFSVCGGALKLAGTGKPYARDSVFLNVGYSPEELYRRSGEPGAWTDVYSLCAVMYRCMTGVTPDEVTDRIYQDQLRAPSSMGVYLASGPEAGLMKGLSVYREDRFPDCEALFQALYEGKSPAAGGPSFYGPIIDPLTDDPPAGNGVRPREPEDNEI